MVPLQFSTGQVQGQWLLPTASYVLINSNAMWSVHSYQLLLHLSCLRASPMDQRFVSLKEGSVFAMVSNIIDGLLLNEQSDLIPDLIASINNPFVHGTISHCPGHLRHFRNNLNQLQDLAVSFDSDEKILGMSKMATSRQYCRQKTASLTITETRSLPYLHLSLTWLVITAPLFSFRFVSLMQLRAPNATITYLFTLQDGLRKLQNIDTPCHYANASNLSWEQSWNHHLSVLVFSDVE